MLMRFHNYLRSSNLLTILLVPFFCWSSEAFNVDNNPAQNRRAFLGGVVTTLVGSSALATVWWQQVQSARAIDDLEAPSPVKAELESVYFGAGCFWHMQHEFAVAERDRLGRKVKDLTSKTGYAGGTRTDAEGRVCYHNMLGIADYGKLGHGEVVNLDLPSDKVVEFASVFFSLFNPNTKDRVDPQDKGPEYRSLMGLPGGTNYPAYSTIQELAADAGLKLVPGKGNDPDTLRKQIIYVYDTKDFPFYQAEIYHQFHNDFQSKPYGASYNKIADIALEDGRLKPVGCPDRV